MKSFNKRRIYMCLSVVLSLVLIIAVVITSQKKTYAKNEDFRISGTTLKAYLGTDTFVSVPDTVTVIGEKAFEGNTTMKKIELPSGLKSIDFKAFSNCTALEDVVIPDNVTKVGPGAFQGCTSLATIEIGKKVSSWGSGVFNDCTSLASVIIDEGNVNLTYYNGALYNGDMSMLYQVLPGREGENYVCPAEVENIDAYSFWNLKNTKNIMISDQVKTIPRSSMINMGSVENVVISNNTKNIDSKAIRNNDNLKQISIPASVKTIAEDAITDNPNVKILTTKNSIADKYGKTNKITVIYSPELPADFNDSNSSKSDKPSTTAKNEVEKKSEAPSKSDKVISVKIPGYEGESESEISNESESLEEKTEEPEVEPSSEASEAEVYLGETKIVNHKAVLFINNTSQKVYGIPDGVSAIVVEEDLDEQSSSEVPAKEETTKSSNNKKIKNTVVISSGDKTSLEASSEASSSKKSEESKSEEKSSVGTSDVLGENKNYKSSEMIPERKYYKDADMEEYTIGKDIKCIGRLAFARTPLKEIVIPEGVVEIGYGAFYTCENLEKVSFPSTVTIMGNKAFAGTKWLNNWLADTSSDDDFLVVGDGILLAYRGNDAHVIIPESVKEIGPEVFKSHEEIEDVEITKNVTKIGSSAFVGCSNLTGIKGCENLKIVMSGAFRGTQISEEDFRRQ